MNNVLHIEQPAWLARFIDERVLPQTDDDRLVEVLALAAENVRCGTGGPFAAVVYDKASGERLSAAVNVVMPSRCAIAHAETLALGMAQQTIGDWTLAERPCVLVSSAEPCGMCLGAIVWSGVRELLFAAGRADVEATGFDEGPRPANWRKALQSRGIEVSGPRQRRTALAVLAAYRESGGQIYNGSGSGPGE